MKSLRFVSFLLVAVLLSACGGEATGDFVGTYSATGTESMALKGGGSSTWQLGGTVNISEGIDTDLLLTDPGTPGCIVPLHLEDGVGRVSVGATCSTADKGLRVTMTFTSGTATLNGQVIQLTYSGTVSAGVDGRTLTGTFITHATLVRVGQ